MTAGGPGSQGETDAGGGSRGRLTKTGRRLVGVAIGVVILHALAQLLQVPDYPILAVSELFQLAAAVSAGLACLAAARRVETAARRGWSLLGAACLTWAGGQVIWAYFSVFAKVDAPYPSFSDIGFLGYVALAFAATLAFSAPALVGGLARLRASLDLVLVTGALFIVLWPLGLEHMGQDSETWLDYLVTMAYALAGIILLGAVVLMMQARSARASSLLYVGFGLTLILVADQAFVYNFFNSTYQAGGLADVGWSAGFTVLTAAAVSARDRPRTSRDAETGGWVALMPVLAIVAGLVGLLLDSYRQDEVHVHPITLGAAVVLVVSAVARQVLFERERAQAGRTRDRALVAAQESGQRAASALENMERAQAAAHYGTWDFDHASNELTGSAEQWRINELEPGPRKGLESIYSRIHPDDLAHVIAEFEAAARLRVPCNAEFRLRFPDGRIKWVAMTLHNVHGADGALTRSVGAIQDITERKRAEEEVARKNALLEEAEATAHLGSWTSDATWTHMAWTPEMWRIVGLEPKAGGPDNSDLLQALPEEDRGNLQRALTEAMDNPTLASHRFDVKVVRPDGDARDVQLDVNFKRDTAGHFEGAQGTLLDVTERARAQREIQKKSVTLERAEDIAHLGSWDLEVATSVLQWSPEVYRLYGIDPATPATLELFFSHIHPEDRAGLVEVLRVASTDSSSQPVMRDFRILRGEEVRYQHGELRIERGADGTVSHILGYVQDTTEQRLAEARAKEADAAEARAKALEIAERERTVFINAMAHELNNPLTPLQLQLKVLQMESQGPLTDGQKHAISLLDRNVKRMGGLVRDLLDVARIQARQLKIEPRPTDIGTLCREVTHTYEPQAIEKGIELTVAGTDGCIANVDSSRIVQVLNNLVSNALKFSSTGAKVHVSHGPHDNQVEVTVQDDGPGLTAQQIEALFKPFSQVLGEKQAGKGGLGLGLYISKGIIERHGGRIWAQSDGPGTGTTFRFTLPASGPVATAPVAIPTLFPTTSK